MSEVELQQLRDQLWQLRNQVADTDARALRHVAEAEAKLIIRLEAIEADLHAVQIWVDNQRSRHASTPQRVFALISAAGTIAAIWLGLRGAGLI